MSDLTEQDLAALDPAGYWEDKYELAKDRIERLQSVMDAAQQLVEQGLPKRTTRDQWNAWHILKDALEREDE